LSDNSIAAARRIVSTSTPANSRASLLALQKQMRAMSGSLLHRAGKVNRKPEKNLWIHIKQMTGPTEKKAAIPKLQVDSGFRRHQDSVQMIKALVTVAGLNSISGKLWGDNMQIMLKHPTNHN
jgi:hypothetical protein